MDHPDESKLRQKAAWDLALRKISRKERTSYELIEILEKAGFESDIATHTVSRLLELRFIDDQRYAAAFTRLQAMRGKGPAVIRLKLRQKGIEIDPETIRDVILEASGKTDLDRALEIIERRYPDANINRSTWKKAYDALVRRGFSFETAKKSLDHHARNSSRSES